MKVRPETAQRALAYLDSGMTVSEAAHDCSITIQSLGHYTCRATENTRQLLRWLDGRPAKRGTDIVALRQIAAGVQL